MECRKKAVGWLDTQPGDAVEYITPRLDCQLRPSVLSGESN